MTVKETQMFFPFISARYHLSASFENNVRKNRGILL